MKDLINELKKELFDSNSNVVSSLRKAHIIAVSKHDSDIDEWIMYELNGYPYDDSTIPDYREVKGQVKGKHPFGGYIPVIFEDHKVELELSTRKIAESVVEIIGFLNDSSKDVFMKYPANVQTILNDTLSKGLHIDYVLYIQKHNLLRIIETIKTRLLDWIIYISDDASSNIFIYPHDADTIVVNGNNNIVQLQYGNNNTINNVVIDEETIKAIVLELEKDNLNEEDKNDILEMLDKITDGIRNKKKQSILRSALIGVKDFMIGVGASLAAAFIQSKLGF